MFTGLCAAILVFVHCRKPHFGVCEKITPRANNMSWNASFQSTKSGAGDQFLLQDCVMVRCCECSLQLPPPCRVRYTKSASGWPKGQNAGDCKRVENQTRPDQTRSDQTRPDQTTPHHPTTPHTTPHRSQNWPRDKRNGRCS